MRSSLTVAEHLFDLDRRGAAAPHCLFMLDSFRQAREMSGGKRRAEASELGAAETLNSAATPWLKRRLPSAGPKLDGLFCERSLLFACLCRSDASRASGSGVCGAQPHAHQWILLQPGIRHLLVPFDGPLAAWIRRRVREIQNVPRLQRMINDRRRRSFRGKRRLS